MAELAIENLSLRFGGLHVLDGVSFAVEPGELFALIGPNGAGKTSVFNCISGLYRGSGRIMFAGQDVSGLAPADIARLGLGRTFQHGELFPHMSVLDNLMTARHARIRTSLLDEMFFTRRVRLEEARHRDKIEEIIEFVELESYRHANVDDLPFGIQKLVGFARALATEPRLLLLDEPSAGLNRDEREDLARFILRIKHEFKLPMIWIEHDMQMIADLADRIHVLNYGRTLVSGAPGAVLTDARVIEAYLGQSHVHRATALRHSHAGDGRLPSPGILADPFSVFQNKYQQKFFFCS
jgi:branched-chain amino acid transport system ATP-binding protein